MTDWAFPVILAAIVTAFAIGPNIRSIGLERAIAIGAGLFGLGALIVLLFAVSGCARKPKTAEPTMTQVARYCFNLAGTFRGQETQGTICISKVDACLFAQVMAVQYGALGKINIVGECWDREEVEP